MYVCMYVCTILLLLVFEFNAWLKVSINRPMPRDPRIGSEAVGVCGACLATAYFVLLGCCTSMGTIIFFKVRRSRLRLLARQLASRGSSSVSPANGNRPFYSFKNPLIYSPNSKWLKE